MAFIHDDFLLNNEPVQKCVPPSVSKQPFTSSSLPV